MSSNIKDPPKNSSRPLSCQSSSSSTSESVKRGAQLFQERLRKQQNNITKKSKLKKQIMNDSNGNKMKKDATKSQENLHKHVEQRSKNEFDKHSKGKSYKSRSDKELKELKPEEAFLKNYVYDTKPSRNSSSGFKLRNYHRLGSTGYRKRPDRIYSVEDSDEEEGRGVVTSKQANKQ